MIKRILLVTCFALLAILGWIWFNQTNGYEIETNEKFLEEAIENLTNQEQVKIRTIKDIGNTKFVLFTIDGESGSSEFTKGRNGKYKIESAGHGTNWIRGRVIHTNEGTYYRVAGKRDNIGRIKAFVSDEVCDIQIPVQEYYIEFCRVDEKIKQPFADGMVIYDIQGTEISRVNISKEQIIN